MNDFSLRSASPCIRSSSGRNWKKLLSQREYSRQSLIKNAWLIHSLVTCAMQKTEELFSSLTHDLSNLWLDSNRLSLNVLKTKCLFTGTRYKISLLPIEPYICLDGHLIERVNSYKCLGVQVDETLSWEAHISEVVSKVAKVLAALRRLRPICPKKHPSYNL